MAMAVCGLRLPEELSERYTRLAKETGRTKTFYMLKALSRGAADPAALTKCIRGGTVHCPCEKTQGISLANGGRHQFLKREV